MDDEEIRKALVEPVRAIAQAVHDALERIPPELSADIYDRGVILTVGSDAPNAWIVPGPSLHGEMALLVQAGVARQHDMPPSGTAFIRNQRVRASSSGKAETAWFMTA
jgi:hypothetical protein